MSGLKQELGLGQGVGLLSTSLLGTGVFAVPALAALVAGDNSLWAWPLLILLVFPIAIVFALLGRHFPSAGGVAILSIWPLGHVWPASPAGCFIGYPGRTPRRPAHRHRFWRALFGWHDAQLLLAELGTGHRLVGRFAWRQLQRQPADVGCRTDCGADRRSLVARRDKPGADPSGPGGD